MAAVTTNSRLVGGGYLPLWKMMDESSVGMMKFSNMKFMGLYQSADSLKSENWHLVMITSDLLIIIKIIGMGFNYHICYINANMDLNINPSHVSKQIPAPAGSVMG